MGETTTAALIGAGASVGTGLIGALTNSAHRQYKYQKKLMALQNYYNVQNASTAYERSRQLTQDQALLEKQGKLNAGINTAFGQDGNVANAASAPQSDGVSVPTPPDVMASQNAFSNGINNAVNQLISAATARANVRKLTSEAEGNEIDNLTRNYRNMKQAGLLTAQIDKLTKETLHQSIVNRHAESRESAAEEEDNARANIASMDASVRGAMNEIDYLNKVQDVQNKIATGELTKRQGAVELKKLALMDSEINKNFASAYESYALAEGQNIENYVNNTTKSDKVATIRSQRIKAWYDAQPKNVQQLIMTSDAVRSAVHTLQTGGDLDWREYKALGAAMGYEGAAKFVETLLDAISIGRTPKPKVSIVKHVSKKK